MKSRKRLSKAARRRRRRRIAITSTIIIVPILIIGGMSYVAHMDWWRISSLTIEGEDKISERALRDQVEDKLEGRYLFLFPKDNTLWYPRSPIRETLKSEFPRINELSVSRAGLTGLEIHLTERTPYAIWCKGAYADPVSGDSPCYFLDRGGYAFAEVASSSESVSVRVREMATSTDATRFRVGSRYQPESFQRLASFLDRLPPLGLEPEQVVHESQDVFRIVLTDGRYLFINADDDLNQVLGNLRLILNHNDLSLRGDDPSSFLYIDLRFDNRIFYKTSLDEAENRAQEQQ